MLSELGGGAGNIASIFWSSQNCKIVAFPQSAIVTSCGFTTLSGRDSAGDNLYSIKTHYMLYTSGVIKGVMPCLYHDIARIARRKTAHKIHESGSQIREPLL